MKKLILFLTITLLTNSIFAQVQVGNTTLSEREVIGGLDVPWEINGVQIIFWVTERSGIVSRVNVETGEQYIHIKFSASIV